MPSKMGVPTQLSNSFDCALKSVFNSLSSLILSRINDVRPFMFAGAGVIGLGKGVGGAGVEGARVGMEGVGAGEREKNRKSRGVKRISVFLGSVNVAASAS